MASTQPLRLAYRILLLLAVALSGGAAWAQPAPDTC